MTFAQTLAQQFGFVDSTTLAIVEQLESQGQLSEEQRAKALHICENAAATLKDVQDQQMAEIEKSQRVLYQNAGRSHQKITHGREELEKSQIHPEDVLGA